MRRTAREEIKSIENYRDYLLLLVRLQLGSRPRAKLDASDVVQQAILHTHERRSQFRGGTEGEMLAWLRAILANALATALRRLDTQTRDPGRERSLEAELERSSTQLEGLLAADQTSPSERVGRGEDLLRLAQAISRLPEVGVRRKELTSVEFPTRFDRLDVRQEDLIPPFLPSRILRRSSPVTTRSRGSRRRYAPGTGRNPRSDRSASGHRRDRRLPPPSRSGPRGDGGRLRGGADLAPAACCTEGSSVRRGDRLATSPALQDRGADGRACAAREDRAGACGRLRARRPLLRHAIHRVPPPRPAGRRRAVPEARSTSYLDVEGFLRFMAVQSMVANADGFFTLAYNYSLFLDPKTESIHLHSG